MNNIFCPFGERPIIRVTLMQLIRDDVKILVIAVWIGYSVEYGTLQV
jgi:hypothetical protein